MMQTQRELRPHLPDACALPLHHEQRLCAWQPVYVGAPADAVRVTKRGDGAQAIDGAPHGPVAQVRDCAARRDDANGACPAVLLRDVDRPIRRPREVDNVAKHRTGTDAVGRHARAAGAAHVGRHRAAIRDVDAAHRPQVPIGNVQQVARPVDGEPTRLRERRHRRHAANAVGGPLRAELSCVDGDVAAAIGRVAEDDVRAAVSDIDAARAVGCNAVGARQGARG